MIPQIIMDHWECSLRCHYCHVHDLLSFYVGFSRFSAGPLFLESIRISFPVHDGSFRNTVLPSNVLEKPQRKYPLDNTRDKIFDRCLTSSSVLRVWKWNLKNYIYIYCSRLSLGSCAFPYAYQVPMSVIGKVYFNSTLVLLNSRKVHWAVLKKHRWGLSHQCILVRHVVRWNKQKVRYRRKHHSDDLLDIRNRFRGSGVEIETPLRWLMDSRNFWRGPSFMVKEPARNGDGCAPWEGGVYICLREMQ